MKKTYVATLNFKSKNKIQFKAMMETAGRCQGSGNGPTGTDWDWFYDTKKEAIEQSKKLGLIAGKILDSKNWKTSVWDFGGKD